MKASFACGNSQSCTIGGVSPHVPPHFDIDWGEIGKCGDLPHTRPRTERGIHYAVHIIIEIVVLRL